ncbi:phage head spike fiber domain-containing protein [Sphingobium aromaticiconvertens]|uniref:phage head spike fiber domain-containing protein n=1 Tax=Sphingobium aromaticiconvertens TaxID=365341 RepID=UPI0030176B02
MKKILLWDKRRPSVEPVRLEIDDAVASAFVRAGVASAADPGESGTLSAGGPIDSGEPVEIMLWSGLQKVPRRVFAPPSVAAIALDIGAAVLPDGASVSQAPLSLRPVPFARKSAAGYTSVALPLNYSSAAYVDAVLTGPRDLRTGKLQVTSGRNIVVQGIYQAAELAGTTSIILKDISESVRVEGVEIVNSDQGDAMKIGGTIRTAGTLVDFPDVTLINTTISGVRGLEAEIHGDCFQADYAMRRFQVFGANWTSSYQVMFIDGLATTSGQPLISDEVDIRNSVFRLRTDLGFEDLHYALYMADSLASLLAGPHWYLTDVSIVIPTGMNPLDAIKPATGATFDGTYITLDPSTAAKVTDLDGKPARIRVYFDHIPARYTVAQGLNYSLRPVVVVPKPAWAWNDQQSIDFGKDRAWLASTEYRSVASGAANYTFARALGNATTWNVAGNLEAVAADTIRLAYDPVTKKRQGAYIEMSKQNILARSTDMSAVGWQVASATLSDAGGTSLGIFNRLTIATSGSLTTRRHQSVAIVSGAVYAVTAFYEAGTSGRARIICRQNTTNLTTVISGPVGNLAVTATDAGVATVVDQTAFTDPASGRTVYRIRLLFTAGAADAVGQFGMGPDSATVDATLIGLGMQVEADSHTSFIITGATSSTRPADALSVPLPAARDVLYVFDDDSVHAGCLSAGSIAIPTSFARRVIKSVSFSDPGKLRSRSLPVKTRRKLEALARGDVALGSQFHYVMGPGDSWLDVPGYVSGALAARLFSIYGDAGGGWTGWAKRGATPYGNVRPSLYPVTVDAGFTNQPGDSSPQASIDLGGLTATSGAAPVQFSLPAGVQATRLAILYRAETAGTHEMRWRVNGGAWTTVTLTTTAAASVQMIDLSAFIPVGASVWDVERVSGTWSPFGHFTRSDAPGILITKAASSGSGLFGWGNTSASFGDRLRQAYQIIDGIAPVDLLMPMLMVNDEGANGTGRTVKQFSDNYDALYTNLRTALPNAAILPVIQPEVKQATSMEMKAYQNIVRAKAMRAENAPHSGLLDLQWVFGHVPDGASPGGATLPYLSTGSNPLLLNEGAAEKHPNNAGVALAVAAIMAVIQEPVG